MVLEPVPVHFSFPFQMEACGLERILLKVWYYLYFVIHVCGVECLILLCPPCNLEKIVRFKLVIECLNLFCCQYSWVPEEGVSTWRNSWIIAFLSRIDLTLAIFLTVVFTEFFTGGWFVFYSWEVWAWYWCTFRTAVNLVWLWVYKTPGTFVAQCSNICSIVPLFCTLFYFFHVLDWIILLSIVLHHAFWRFCVILL